VAGRGFAYFNSGAGASAIDSKKRGLFFINQKKKGFSFKRD
jgi:hypothetical protein